MRSLACVLVLLCVLSVSGRNIMTLRGTSDKALAELRIYKPGFKTPDIPDPAKVIIIILRNYCQLLIEQGVVNLPDYCYTLPQSPRINTPHTMEHGTIINPSDGGLGRPVA